MTNLLAIPERWQFTVGGGNPQWNGTDFVLTNTPPDAVVFGIFPVLGASAPSPGDTYTGQVSTSFAGAPGESLYLLLISAANDVLQALQISEGGELSMGSLFFSWDAYAAGPGAKIFMGPDPTDATQFPAYAGQNLTLTPDEVTSYNCACDDEGVIVTDTLLNLRTRLMRRLGFSAQASSPPPGMAALLDDFLQSAQVLLYTRYSALRLRRWFTWPLLQGVRFYDLAANRGLCTLKLDGRRIEWAGVSCGDDVWTPIECGVEPTSYASNISGIVCAYEVRQCIEVWPAPSDSTWLLRIKGDVGLLPFVDNDDRSSIDAEPLFLMALANAKAHYGQPDAGNYSNQVQTMTRDLTAASHGTRKYLPGGNNTPRNLPMPKMV
ncbi:MAG: hypothetical protein V4636_20050 [Pseudomonadota bacterium]